VATAVAGSVFLLYAALASGPDVRVRTFRALSILLAIALPILGLRLIPAGEGRPFGGGVLVVLFAGAFVHRGQVLRRRPGMAFRTIRRVRWGLEAAGLLLFLLAGLWLLLGRPVPLPLAFWSLFLLRLSIADLLYAGRLARETGLAGSAATDLKSAARSRAHPSRRVARAVRGLAKLALVLVWLALPLLAALAPREVAGGDWPRAAILLALYPAAALAITSALLLLRALRDLHKSRRDAMRGLAVAVATALWLVRAFTDPSFAAYRGALPGLVLVETAFGFLLGAASARR